MASIRSTARWEPAGSPLGVPASRCSPLPSGRAGPARSRSHQPRKLGSPQAGEARLVSLAFARAARQSDKSACVDVSIDLYSIRHSWLITFLICLFASLISNLLWGLLHPSVFWEGNTPISEWHYTRAYFGKVIPLLVSRILSCRFFPEVK